MTLFCFFFFFFFFLFLFILNTKVPLMFQSSLYPIILNGSGGKKLILMFLLFLVTAAILDS